MQTHPHYIGRTIPPLRCPTVRVGTHRRDTLVSGNSERPQVHKRHTCMHAWMHAHTRTHTHRPLTPVTRASGSMQTVQTHNTTETSLTQYGQILHTEKYFITDNAYSKYFLLVRVETLEELNTLGTHSQSRPHFSSHSTTLPSYTPPILQCKNAKTPSTKRLRRRTYFNMRYCDSVPAYPSPYPTAVPFLSFLRTLRRAAATHSASFQEFALADNLPLSAHSSASPPRISVLFEPRAAQDSGTAQPSHYGHSKLPQYK